MTRGPVAVTILQLLAFGAGGSPAVASPQDHIALYSNSVAAYRRERAAALPPFLTIPRAELDAALAAATAHRGGWEWRQLRAHSVP